MTASKKKKIWIDLENSPHVPFFKPIIEELHRRGYRTFVTARDCSQTCGLADMFHLQYLRIGKHYGKNKILKLFGLILRVLRLMPIVLREKPALALSHGSRTQLLLAWLLGIPSAVMIDYEYAQALPFANPDWLIVPEVISHVSKQYTKSRILKYPGIKEDVYVPRFRPDSTIVGELKIADSEVVVTVRPPATDAHYFVPESEELFLTTMEFLTGKENVKLILLPRNNKQAAFIRETWAPSMDSGKILIPSRVMDGLNILWHSDFVISGGGTMNREAAALGVPVYSIYRGKIGGVDRYLAESGRLTLLQNAADVSSKIIVARRRRPERPEHINPSVLETVVGHIITITEFRSGESSGGWSPQSARKT